MRRLYEPGGRPASCGAALLGLLILEMIAASCASSQDAAGARGDDTDRESSSDATANASEAGCDVDSGACAKKQVLACDDFEWCPAKTNLPIGLGLSGVWGSGANDVWVVGSTGSVLHWDGQEWTSVSVATIQSLYAVWGTGPNDIWIASSLNTIFRTTGFADNTAQWSPVTAIASPTPDSPDSQGKLVRAIWGTSPSDIWVGGDSFATYLPDTSTLQSAWRSTVIDGGAAWTPVLQNANIFGVDNRRDIRAIWGSGPEDIWIVGSKEASPRSFVARTNALTAADDDIPVWTEFETQSISVLNAVWGSGPGDVWTVGDYGTIRHFTPAAKVWSIVDSPTTRNLRSLWGTGPKDIWAVGEHGTLLHYDGTAWRTSTAALPPGAEPDLYSVWGSGPSDVWAVGSEIIMHFSGAKPGAQGAAP